MTIRSSSNWIRPRRDRGGSESDFPESQEQHRERWSGENKAEDDQCPRITWPIRMRCHDHASDQASSRRPCEAQRNQPADPGQPSADKPNVWAVGWSDRIRHSMVQP
jgi:hypothetical protein